MAHRLFEGKTHALLYKKFRPVPPPELINRIMSFLKEKPVGPLETAVDVGCGSGQSTTFFAPYFTKVIGTDVSENMIKEATASNEFQNVSYKVTPAEKIPMADNSVQLITVSQAAHWFDLPKFFDEGRRVLSPLGVMAIFAYAFPTYRACSGAKDAENKNTLLQKVWDDFNRVNFENYWDPGRKKVDNRYSDIVIPYEDFQRDDSIFIESDATVTDIGNYVQTWSAYQAYCKSHGEKAGAELIQQLQNSIMEILDVSTDPQSTKIVKRTSYFLLMARKLASD